MSNAVEEFAARGMAPAHPSLLGPPGLSKVIDTAFVKFEVAPMSVRSLCQTCHWYCIPGIAEKVPRPMGSIVGSIGKVAMPSLLVGVMVEL